ncbi:LuxR C-terminal-related transcriptional regulator, partial [Actinomadura miaoliensis]
GASPAADAVSGSASIAAMLERAADLSPDRADRVRRMAAAAQAAADAGLAEQATALADRAAAETSDPVLRADLVRLRGVLADEQDRTAEAYRLFSDTADTVAGTAPDLAGYLLFQAASAAANAGDFAALERAVERAEDLGLPNAHLARALARMYAGQNAFTEGRVADGARAGRELLDGMGPCIGPREVTRAAWLRLLLGDVEGAHEAAAGLAERLRDQGAIGLLSTVLPLLARTHLQLGRHRDALGAATEGMRIAEDTGQHRHRVYHKTVLALLAAIEGDEERCAELAAEPLERGVAPGVVHAAGALSLLDLGLGRYEAALNRLLGVVSGPYRQGAIASLPDLVEAAVRAGRPEDGRDAAAWYADWAAQVGRPWAHAVALRCRALLEPEEQAGKTFAEAVELHRQGGPPFERARTELLYGEWLRRARRRNDARARLHAALETFERLGAAPWAERARGELRAAGESLTGAAPDEHADLLARLTPQELQVVRLAATGLSNREIGARLFLSPRTVGYHLYKAYPKLGVASRAELARLDLG